MTDETKAVSSLNKDIAKVRKKLIKKAKSSGISENFGQSSIKDLEDKYLGKFSTPIDQDLRNTISEFENELWEMDYQNT